MSGHHAILFLVAVGLLAASTQAGSDERLPGTELLTWDGDLAMRMVDGIDHYAARLIDAAPAQRAAHWRRAFDSAAIYNRSVTPHRDRLRRILGAQDPRVPFGTLLRAGAASEPDPLAQTSRVRVRAVRWPVFAGVEGEGLLLEPRKRAPRASAVLLPDCDELPEKSAGLLPGVPPERQAARRLAESGCRVLVPFLIDRDDRYSGHPAVRMTNQPHREFLYRGAFEMGRHLLGFEVQKVLAAVDWLKSEGPGLPVGVAGYGEGGLLALFAGALDLRVEAVLVSGAFRSRQTMWREPIYRNIWDYLTQFGDAETASLVAPRRLIVEESVFPRVDGPPPARDGRSGAAPGALTTPPGREVSAEIDRAEALVAGLRPRWKIGRHGDSGAAPWSRAALDDLARSLGMEPVETRQETLADPRSPLDLERRRKRQFDQLVEHVQVLMRDGEYRRAELWSGVNAASADTFRDGARALRDRLWDEVIGRLPPPEPGVHPRSRRIYDEPAFRGYEVVLDVWQDVFAYGILLVPRDLKPGERRPVVVCQHGLEGRPTDVADPRLDHPAYHRFAARLADRGFVVFAPQNPYIGQDRFRVLQRKLNPLGKSLFSVIVRQHERILEWLATQSYVDPERIAFYGLSYGGKTAMRVPALLERYCLSICSADYNEWIWKNVSSRARYSYLFTGEYEMVEFNLGNTFNYAEMSWLIFPRPFMVERGHDDGVAPDEWVAYEFARTFQRYNRLGLGDRAKIEFFNGPHTIHGQGTFAFLHHWLRWPPPGADR